MGFVEDDVLAFFMHNCPDYITCLTGAIGAGIIVTPINPSYTVDELAKQISMSNSKGIIISNDSLALVKKALTHIKSKINKQNISFEKNIISKKFRIFTDTVIRLL